MKFRDKLNDIYSWLRLSTYIEPDKSGMTWIFRPNEIEIFRVQYDDNTKIYRLTYLAGDRDNDYEYSSTEQFVILDLIKIILYKK